jgi:hypothetical protein
MSVLGMIPVKVYRLGGNSAQLNVTAITGAGLAGIKGSSGVLFRIIPIVAGSGGALTINDLAVNTGAAAANQLFTIPNTGLTVGVPITLEVPFANGLVISAITTGGQFVVTYD